MTELIYVNPQNAVGLQKQLTFNSIILKTLKLIKVQTLAKQIEGGGWSDSPLNLAELFRGLLFLLFKKQIRRLNVPVEKV